MLLKPNAVINAVTFCLLPLSAVVDAAELRNSVGNKQVVRPMSYDDRYSQDGDIQDGDIIVDPVAEELVGGCDGCGGGSCDSFGPCGDCCIDLSGTWFRLEYLLWWRQGSSAPALVTTSPLGTDQADAGLNPSIVLFGDQTLGRDAKAGGRITIGHWLDRCHVYSVEARYFNLGDSTTHFATDSGANPIIARPFFNTDPAVNAADAELISFADASGVVTSGNIDVLNRSDVLGGDVYFKRLWCKAPCWRVDMLAGYQFARIDEELNFSSFTDAGNGVTLAVRDMFATENEFHGGQFGLSAEFQRGCWKMNVLAKLGLGRMAQRVAISGSRVTTAGGQTQTFDSGLFAQSLTGNTGTFEESSFNAVPEFGIDFSYAITPCLSLNFGASLIYWNSVAQPIDQIDFSVDGRLLDSPDGPIIPPPPTNPRFDFRTSDYYVHGINVGLEYRY